jgi:hypothetical protein
MCVELEPMEEMERELREAFQRRPAPPSLKRRLMEKRRTQRRPIHAAVWQRLAATLALAAVLGGAMEWRHREEERRKGEAAREQVLTALRITNHALDQVNTRLAAHDREQE